jgi:SNF2 family DNA or RNA helicase
VNQVAGVEWLAFNRLEGRSSILADEMGLGKTAQAIAFLDATWRHTPSGAPALVVVPLSVVVNWQRELARYIFLSRDCD